MARELQRIRMTRRIIQRKIRRSWKALLRHRKTFLGSLAFSGSVLLYLAWRLLGPASPDLDALDRPVYEPIVNAKQVTLEIVHINGQPIPEDALKKALDVFKTYLSGELRVVDDGSLTLEMDRFGRMSDAQLDGVMARCRQRSPSTINLIVAPDILFSRATPNAIAATYPPTSHKDLAGFAILVNGREEGNLEARYPGDWNYDWSNTLLHELCHTLCVPARGGHIWGGREGNHSHHCTHPSCILYPWHDWRTTWAQLWRQGRPGLCSACLTEIRVAQARAKGKLIEQISPRQALLDEAEATIRLNPGIAQACDHSGYIYLKLKDYKSAMSVYDEAIALNPKRAEGHYLRGSLYGRMKDYTLAIDELSRAIALDAKNEAYYLNRAIDLYHKEYYSLAIADLQTALRIAQRKKYGDQARTGLAIQNCLSWYLATCPDASCRNGDYAVMLARQACQWTLGKKSSYLGTLAAAYAEAGRFEMAKEVQAQAIALETGKRKALLQEVLKVYYAGKPYRETPQESEKWNEDEPASRTETKEN